MAKVLIKLRDLDTDAREEATVDIARVPDNPLRQGQYLAEVVAERHPDARAKSFADGVASFVDRRHLIIARYVHEDVADAIAAVHGSDASQSPKHSSGVASTDPDAREFVEALATERSASVERLAELRLTMRERERGADDLVHELYGLSAADRSVVEGG